MTHLHYARCLHYQHAGSNSADRWAPVVAASLRTIEAAQKCGRGDDAESRYRLAEVFGKFGNCHAALMHISAASDLLATAASQGSGFGGEAADSSAGNDGPAGEEEGSGGGERLHSESSFVRPGMMTVRQMHQLAAARFSNVPIETPTLTLALALALTVTLTLAPLITGAATRWHR